MSRVALEVAHASLSNTTPLPVVSATCHSDGKLGNTFLAGVPRALSENGAHLHWLGFTPPHKG